MRLLAAILTSTVISLTFTLVSLLGIGPYVMFYVQLFIVYPLTFLVTFGLVTYIIWLIIHRRQPEITLLRVFCIRTAMFLVLLIIANALAVYWLILGN